MPSQAKPVKETKKPDIPMNHRSVDERHNVPQSINAKKFDSSLGSDTGTSTRESDEGSEERTSVDLSPGQAKIFDSLAAELRAKLNGNGPPLLLPPRDYDTMHRSKGNLAAIELRRCRNKMIVGNPTKQGVSSRGSSGIGSDIAPSPERQEAHSSSGTLANYIDYIFAPDIINLLLFLFIDDDWMLKKRDSGKAKSPIRIPVAEKSVANAVKAFEKHPPSYLYPLQKPAYIIPSRNDSDNERNNSPPVPLKEEEIKLKLVRPRNLEAHFKRIMMNEKQYEEKDNDNDQQLSNEERFFQNDSVKYMPERSLDRKKVHGDAKNVHRTKSGPPVADRNDGDDRFRYHHAKSGHHQRYSEKPRKSREHDGFPFSENLTDKEKYHQSLIKKQQTTHSHREYPEDGFRPAEPLPSQQKLRESKPIHRVDDRAAHSKGYRSDFKSSSRYEDIEYDRNQPFSSMPRHRSPENCVDCEDECTSECERDFTEKPYPSLQYNRQMYDPRQRNMHPIRISPEAHDISKERAFHAKEKLQHMDRHWHHSSDKDMERSYPMDKSKHSRRMIARQDIPDMSLQPPPPPPNLKSHISHQSPGLDWSSDDEHFGRTSSPSNVRIIPREHYEKNSGARLAASKSLSNLAKGYRHSYAEPVHGQMPRNSGRVGLAAVNPY